MQSRAHFIPLSEIIQNYNSRLYDYISANKAIDVVVTMPITVDVVKQGKQKFFVAVAVTTQFDAPEPLSDEVNRLAPKDHQTIFAWIPADIYGTDDFCIYIGETAVGEKLKNGLVGEVIEKVKIEHAVIALAQSKGIS